MDFYKEIASKSPIPIVPHNIPPLVGYSIAPETVALLSNEQNIAGIKDTSYDFSNFEKYVKTGMKSFKGMAN